MAAPILQDDSASWATSVTGWGKGVLVPGVSNPITLTILGDVLDGKSVGSHEPFFQVHVKTGTHLIFRVVVNGFEVDYLPVAGPNEPSSEADLNIFALFPFVVLDGEVTTIEFWTTLDSSSADPAPSEQAFWTFTNIRFTSSTLPPQPPTLNVNDAIVTTTAGQPISTSGSHGPGSSGQPHTLTADIGTMTPSTPQTLPGTFIWNLANPQLGDAGTVTITNSDGAQSTDRTFTLVVNTATTGDIYVSGAGNDAADGLSAGTAIRTWREAESRVVDNDLILLERGYVYDEFTTGVTFHPGGVLLEEMDGVVIAPYGSGAAPVIDGKGLIPTGNLFPTIKYGLVQFRNCINCTIRGIRIINSRHVGYLNNNGLNGPTSANNTIEECHIQYIRSWGILDATTDHNNGLDDSHPHVTGSVARYNTVEDVCEAVNEPTNDSTPGVQPGTSRSDNNSVGSAGGEACTFRRTDGYEFYGNIIRNTNKEGFATSNSVGGTVYNNRIGARYPTVGNASVPILRQETAYGFGTGGAFYLDHTHGLDAGVHQFHGYGNEVFGDASGIIIGSEGGGAGDDILIENNVCWGHNTLVAGFIGGAGNTLNPGDSTNVRWYHNLFSSDQSTQNVFKISQPIAELAGLEIKGNIFHRSVVGGQSMVWNADGQTAGDYVGVDYDYNSFFNSGGSILGFKGTNFVTANPLFESHSFSASMWPGGTPGQTASGELPQLNTVYYLQPGSPLIGAVPTPYSTDDMVGNARPTPAAIGPFDSYGLLANIPITIYRTLNTIYLESLDDSKYVNWEYGGEVNHEWILNPVDGKYQSAIWVGDAAGKITVDGLLYDPPAYPSLAKPSTYDNELTATPATFAAQLAVAEGATGSVRILMGDGTYRDGDLTIAKSGLTLEAENPGSAICTDEWTGALVWSLVSGNVYKTSSIQPADPKQVYATVSSLSERLSGGEPVTGAEWNATTLNAAAGMGGWYVDAGELHVKLPDDSDPTGKIILSGENDFEDFAEFTGDNVWVDGLIFEFFGKVISPTTTWYDQNESSALRFTASINVGVTNCTFRYLRKHAINCEGCVDVLVETNSFLDNQNEMTYHQIRNSGLGTPGISHLASARALYSRCEDVNHLGNVHDFNLSAAYVAGGRGVDVMNNTFTRARNVPVVVADGRVAVGGAIDDIGWGVTVANNSYDRVGWSVPNNENNAETGIAYWINNWVEECAWPGNNYDGGTIGSFNMHRYGGADSGIFLGLQMIYENIYVSTQKDASFTAYRNWYNQNKNLHAGSRMWNNVISSPDDTGVDATIWSHLSTGDPNVPTSLLQIEFDWNQYYMDGEENAFRQIAKVTLATMQTDHPTFEPNGTYSDPQITGTTIGNRSPTRFIKGVSGNSVLGL